MTRLKCSAVISFKRMYPTRNIYLSEFAVSYFVFQTLCNLKTSAMCPIILLLPFNVVEFMDKYEMMREWRAIFVFFCCISRKVLAETTIFVNFWSNIFLRKYIEFRSTYEVFKNTTVWISFSYQSISFSDNYVYNSVTVSASLQNWGKV